MQIIFEISAAYILDIFFGDPRWFPHPVKGIGFLIRKAEHPFRKMIKNERLGGIIFAVFIIGTAWYIVYSIIQQASLINRRLDSVISIFFIYTSIAIKDLRVESMKVYNALAKKDLPMARKNLSLIVGRDTQNLETQGIIRATVETVSENTVDGIISPLFYAFLGGAPLALTYKAINTLDSMLGYKNEKYENFGWASAKIDDIANFIPARISILLLSAASWIMRLNGWNSLKAALRDGKKNPSPNSGIPEAAVAGALGIQLGGTNSYDSKPVSKPFIGDNLNTLDIKHITKSIKISYLCSFITLITGIFLIWIIGRR